MFSGSLSDSEMLFITMVYNSFDPTNPPSPRERHDIVELLALQSNTQTSPTNNQPIIEERARRFLAVFRSSLSSATCKVISSIKQSLRELNRSAKMTATSKKKPAKKTVAAKKVGTSKKSNGEKKSKRPSHQIARATQSEGGRDHF